MVIMTLALLGCYVMGSVPFGLILCKLLRGIDIRDYGSGNIGASNVMRTLGTIPGSFVMLLDAAKGFSAVLICYHLGLTEELRPWIVVAGALLSILGHTFSMFLRFKGGKGVATSLGVVFGLNWPIALIAFFGWLIIVAITRYISIASIAIAIYVPLQMIIWKSQNVPIPYVFLTGLAALAIVLKHIPNIKRLLNGTETRVGHKDEDKEE
ncbi:MAG: glycerol-3-phosphate 1-O-acyltransferase PlsY [Armatimonadetes bacterium]|nr:glycerol-3-phosphate 1-O-acyltransferase PlsY [Armatimonadota bacterium]